MEKEVGKQIDGYPTYYVSNRGNIKNTKYGKERLLKPGIGTSGYLLVTLCYNGKSKGYLIHRLVAKAFIPNPAGLPQVNHIDENKSHNYAENLEGCDASYNINYGTAKKRKSAKLLNYPMFSKPVRQMTIKGEVIGTYPSISEAVRVSGMSFNSIMGYLRGTIKKPRTFKWEFVG